MLNHIPPARVHRGLLIGLAAFAALAAGLSAQEKAEDQRQVFAQIDQILSELTQITGLKPQKKVESDIIDRARLKQFLEERIKKVVKPEDLRSEELVLKKFGFVPAAFDLKQTTVDLLTEQAAAFYDHREKKLFLLDHSTGMTQEVALIHELAHALADQHFKLEKFIETAGKSDDAALARAAVVEGQATWLMSEFMARKLGQSLQKNPTAAEMMVRMAENNSSGQFPVLDKAPPYIRESLIFPYTRGMRFQQAVVEKMGQQSFTEVFRRPPTSTRQILHPELYLQKVDPVLVKLPDVPNQGDYKKVAEGTIGEFDHAVLIGQYVGAEARPRSEQWRGGSYRLVEGKRDGRLVLAYISEWASAEAARQYFADYQKILEGKWKVMDVASRTETAVHGRGDDGHFRLSRDGARVTSIEGLPAPVN